MTLYHIVKPKRGAIVEILDSILELRNDFGGYEDDENFRVFEIALPVAIFECSANQKVDSAIDSLAKATLKFLKLGVENNDELAKLLNVTPDMIKRVKTQKLAPLGFIDENSRVTENGVKCLEDKLEDAFQEDTVYGNMFVNLIDGEIMPYFWEGKLPFAKELSDFEYPAIHRISTTNLADINNPYLPHFTEAYKKFHKIKDYCKPQMSDVLESELEEPSEFDMLTGSFDDVIFTEFNDDAERTDIDFDEPKTLADVYEEEKSEKTYVKIFKSTQKLLYIYTQLIVSRNRPEDFIILSPFDNNVTTWYAKRIPFMKLAANNVTIGRIGDKDGELFGDFMSEITQEFLIEFPELADSSYSFFAKSHFPNLANLNATDRKILNEVLKDYYNSYVLNCNDKNSPNAVIGQMGLALETILGIFRGKIKDIRRVCENSLLTPYDDLTYQEIFQRYNIVGCKGHLVAENCSAKLKGWARNNTLFRGSPTEKYCFLVLEGYIHSAKPTAFIKVLKTHGRDFTDRLDNVISVRNKYTSHNDRIGAIEIISNTDFEKAKDDFVFVINALINGLYETEKENN